MRYGQAILTSLAVVIAAFAFVYLARGDSRSSNAPDNQASTVAHSGAVASSGSTPTSTRVTISEDAAVEAAKGRANAFGELSPVLVDARQMTLAEAYNRLTPKDTPREGPVAGKGVAHDEDLVWLVRMKGRFVAPHAPRS